jgi:hypothetical protein
MPRVKKLTSSAFDRAERFFRTEAPLFPLGHRLEP